VYHTFHNLTTYVFKFAKFVHGSTTSDISPQSLPPSAQLISIRENDSLVSDRVENDDQPLSPGSPVGFPQPPPVPSKIPAEQGFPGDIGKNDGKLEGQSCPEAPCQRNSSNSNVNHPSKRQRKLDDSWNPQSQGNVENQRKRKASHHETLEHEPQNTVSFRRQIACRTQTPQLGSKRQLTSTFRSKPKLFSNPETRRDINVSTCVISENTYSKLFVAALEKLFETK
jgi:hypothetical protein